MSAVLICVAAWLPPVSCVAGPSGGSPAPRPLGGIALVVASVYERLPEGIDPALSPETAASPQLEGHPSARRAARRPRALRLRRRRFRSPRVDRGSELSLWLANACVLAAFARLHYFMFPSLYSEWVYTGDFFRLGFYVLLVIGAAREIARFQRGAAEQPCSRSGGGWRVSSTTALRRSWASSPYRPNAHRRRSRDD